MRPPITCATHGQQKRAYVCDHVLQTFHDKQPRGFIWAANADDEHEALCLDCANLPRDQFKERWPELVRHICDECFKTIGRTNGVRWPGDS